MRITDYRADIQTDEQMDGWMDGWDQCLSSQGLWCRLDGYFLSFTNMIDLYTLLHFKAYLYFKDVIHTKS